MPVIPEARPQGQRYPASWLPPEWAESTQWARKPYQGEAIMDPLVGEGDVVPYGKIMKGLGVLGSALGTVTSGDNLVKWYSRLERAIENLVEKGPKEFYAKKLANAAPKEELETTGVAEFLREGGHTTRQELADVARVGRIEIQNRVLRQHAAVDSPRTIYSDYTTPGGSNYREVLTTLPTPNEKEISRLRAEADDLYGRYLLAGQGPEGFTGVEAKALEQQYAKVSNTILHYDQSFRQEHFEDVLNLLYHTRIKDYNLTKGGRVMVLQELQSDWHQLGKARGYSKNVAGEQETLEHYRNEPFDPDIDYTSELPVPDAPFKGNAWVAHGLKRALKEAVDNGYDYLAWLPGERVQQLVGGKIEGQKQFYNEVIPAIMERLTGKKVERLQVPTSSEYQIKRGYEAAQDVHAIRLSPELKAKLHKEGLPIFEAAGATAAGASIYAEENQ